jgi:hypothetical protein
MALLSHQPAETVRCSRPRPNALLAKAVQGNILNIGQRMWRWPIASANCSV